MSSVNLVLNTGLTNAATGLGTGVDDEPTAARFLGQAFLTGNTYASRSQDGGSTWTQVDPFAVFPFTAGGLCCDQITLHERTRNLWVWLLQYKPDANGSNIFRLAVSTDGTPAPTSWFYWDFSPGLYDPTWATGVTFDRPDMATANEHLYISYNVFRGTTGAATMVFKISLAQLALHQLSYVYYNTTEDTSFCLARGATTDMYLLSETVQNPARIYRWPDADGTAWSRTNVTTPGAWTGSTMPGTYVSLCPNGSNWLGKLTVRATAGWVTDGNVGFLWHALPTNDRPQPWLKGLVVDTTTMTVVSEPDLWNADQAYAYPATCPNDDGVVGISLFFGGGGTLDPRHVVGFREDPTWVLAGTRDSTDGPYGDMWGDYLSCALGHPDDTNWVASGYTLQGGSTFQFVDPQYVEFNVGP
ncbi:hypothetical protein ACFVQ4_16495 [Streptomyces laurentii]|uniref:hypothetical protein n=1 Tax=Streptomyces laurentii TaxID=39478 RepID=UPI0036AE17DA